MIIVDSRKDRRYTVPEVTLSGTAGHADAGNVVPGKNTGIGKWHRALLAVCKNFCCGMAIHWIDVDLVEGTNHVDIYTPGDFFVDLLQIVLSAQSAFFFVIGEYDLNIIRQLTDKFQYCHHSHAVVIVTETSFDRIEVC